MKPYLRIENALVMFSVLILMNVACATAPTPTAAPPTTPLTAPTSTPMQPSSTPTQPAATLALPTAAPIPRTPTATPPTQTPVPKDERGFSINETAHGAIFSQPGVSDLRAQEVSKAFEIAYQVVAEELAPSEKRPRLYVYRSEDELFQALIANWNYSEWFKNTRAIPRMHRDYIAWIPPLPRGDAWFISHEYSHRIIEQIAGINSQFNYKWFDEGLAEYAGFRALAQLSPGEAKTKWQAKSDLVMNAQRTATLIHFRDMTTEDQWVKIIERDSRLAYAQSGIAMEYLISQRGMSQVKSVLGLVGKGTLFLTAFQNVYGFTVDDFEKQFFDYIAKLSSASSSGMCFTIDGQANDWQKIKPLIVDSIYPPIARTADVREVSAVTCKGALYLMIAVDGAANADEVTNFAFEVDTDGNENPEYQPGFDRTRAWLWNLKGTGYADMQKNMTELAGTEFKIGVGQVVEFMIPLRLLDNSATPRIRVYTFVSGQMANRRTAWGTVPPLEGQ